MLWFAAGALARTPTLGSLVLPLTPDGPEPYVGAVEEDGATSTTWTADVERFACVATPGLVEVHVDPANWPSPLPKKVTCYGADGRRVKLGVKLDPSFRQAAFVGDGTLLMPRAKNRPVTFDGAPPMPDLVVQQGTTVDLDLQCHVEPGNVLRVVVPASTEDGDGGCTLNTRYGETVRLHIRVVTVE